MFTFKLPSDNYNALIRTASVKVNKSKASKSNAYLINFKYYVNNFIHKKNLSIKQ